MYEDIVETSILSAKSDAPGSGIRRVHSSCQDLSHVNATSARKQWFRRNFYPNFSP